MPLGREIEGLLYMLRKLIKAQICKSKGYNSPRVSKDMAFQSW